MLSPSFANGLLIFRTLDMNCVGCSDCAWDGRPENRRFRAQTSSAAHPASYAPRTEEEGGGWREPHLRVKRRAVTLSTHLHPEPKTMKD